MVNSSVEGATAAAAASVEMRGDENGGNSSKKKIIKKSWFRLVDKNSKKWLTSSKSKSFEQDETISVSSKASFNAEKSASKKGESFKNVKFIDEVASAMGDDERSVTSSRSYLLRGSTKGDFFLSKLLKKGKKKCKNDYFDSIRDESLLHLQQMEEDELNRSEHDEISHPWNHFKKVKNIDEKDVSASHHSIRSVPAAPPSDRLDLLGHDYVIPQSISCGNDSSTCPPVKHHETMLDALMKAGAGTVIIPPKEDKNDKEKQSMLDVMESLFAAPLTVVRGKDHEHPSYYAFRNSPSSPPSAALSSSPQSGYPKNATTSSTTCSRAV